MFIFLCSRVVPKGAVLTIIDGMGESAWPQGNGIEKAKTPNMDFLKSNFPYENLVAAQQPVGLIRREPGSSSVGHQTIGLGRTTPSYFQQLEKSMNEEEDNYLGKNKVLLKTIRHAKDNNGRVHFAGLCTDVGIFSHIKFFPPMFEAVKKENVSEILVHCFFTHVINEPSSYLNRVEEMFPKGIKARIASVHTGLTALDKFENWHLSNKTASTIAKGSKNEMERKELFETLDMYGKNYTDYDPFIVKPASENHLKEGDSLILFQHREDQSFQVAKLLMKGKITPKNVMITPMILYDKTLSEFEPILPSIVYNNSLGSWISQKGFKQIRVAEEYKKYHITSFLSGGINQPVFPGETDVINFTSIPDSIAEFYPEMNASNVFKVVENAIKSEEYKLIAVNYANVDAIGHSGNTTAVSLACEYIDSLIGKMIKLCKEHNYVLFIVADHGNGEENEAFDGSRVIDHTVNNVPFMTTLSNAKVRRQTLGKVHYIGNVAATIIRALGMDVPPEMEPPIFDFIDDENETKNENIRSHTSCEIVLFLIGMICGVMLVLIAHFISIHISDDFIIMRAPGEPQVNA